MSDEMIQYHRLGNGLRIVARRVAMPVEHCGVAVNAGSRDEAAGLHGLAHFVEHTIFKGTSSHRAAYVRDRMELVGGELNAYTTKEETVVYSTFPAGNLARAMALLGEMVADAVFPEAEIGREKQVVAEEIDTYLDTPSDAVFDDFEDLIYAGSPLAHNILGTRETLAGFDQGVCRRWLEERFTPGRMVLFYSGPMEAERVFRMAERRLGGLSRADVALERVVPPTVERFEVVNDKVGSYQAHTLLGARVPGMLDERRTALALLVNVLGGPGMNSLLNVALRERRGLVYTTDASTSLMSDNGLLTIYFGCDPADVSRCLRVVGGVVDALAGGLMSERRLEAARRQLIGQLTVGSMNSEQVAISMGRSVLYRGRAVGFDETVEALRAVSAADLREAAAPLASLSRLTLV